MRTDLSFIQNVDKLIQDFQNLIVNLSNPSDILTLLEEFCTTDVSVQRLGGDCGSSEKKLDSANLA